MEQKPPFDQKKRTYKIVVVVGAAVLWKTEIFPEISKKKPSTGADRVIHRDKQPGKNSSNYPHFTFPHLEKGCGNGGFFSLNQLYKLYSRRAERAAALVGSFF